MQCVSSKLIAPQAARFDDGDPHLFDPAPAQGGAISMRWRPSLSEIMALVGGAEIELTLDAKGGRLAVVANRALRLNSGA